MNTIRGCEGSHPLDCRLERNKLPTFTPTESSHMVRSVRSVKTKEEKIVVKGWLVPPIYGSKKGETSKSKSMKSGKMDRDMFRYFGNGIAMLQGRALGDEARRAMTFDTNGSLQRLQQPISEDTSLGVKTLLSAQQIISSLLPAAPGESIPEKTLSVVERVILRRALIAMVRTAIQGEAVENEDQQTTQPIELKDNKK